MKTSIIIVLSLILVFMVLQSFVFKSTRDTEQHKYTLIKTMEEFEIRFYPRSILATVNMEESTYKNSANRGDRKSVV